MSGPPPPLRFLILVLGGWTAARAVFLTVDAQEPVPAQAAPVGVGQASRAPAPEVRAAVLQPGMLVPSSAAIASLGSTWTAAPPLPAAAPPKAAGPAPLLVWARPAATPDQTLFGGGEAAPVPAAQTASRSVARESRVSRWSVSTWLFARRGGGASLAPGGTLGGGQAGARIGYRLNRAGARPLALTARVYSPLGRRSSAEAALGLEWKPLRRVPVHLVAERRQALGREGRSAFGLTAYGGVDEVALGAFRLDGFAQAGVVGTKSRDLFADAAVRVALPLDKTGRLRIGGGAWTAAQPGVSRADLGPTASLRLPVAGRTVTLAADWRLRVAGSARPGSGPALTLAADF